MFHSSNTPGGTKSQRSHPIIKACFVAYYTEAVECCGPSRSALLISWKAIEMEVIVDTGSGTYVENSRSMLGTALIHSRIRFSRGLQDADVPQMNSVSQR